MARSLCNTSLDDFALLCLIGKDEHEEGFPMLADNISRDENGALLFAGQSVAAPDV